MDENEIKKKRVQEAIDAIQDHATQLFALIEPGMTICVDIPNIDTIIIPNAPKTMGRLIITRTISYIRIASK